MKINQILSLKPVEIDRFEKYHQDEDLPSLTHYWKLVLLNEVSEKDLYNYLVKYGSGHNTDGIVKGLLGSELLKTFYIEKEPIIVVVKAHLILEKFLDEILKQNKIIKKIKKFYDKVSFINSSGLFEQDIYNDLIQINLLRNMYAHDLYFNIGNFDMSLFSIGRGIYDGLPIKKLGTKEILNVKFFQFHVLYNILGRISHDFPFLGKLKTKKVLRRSVYNKEIGEPIGKIISQAYKQVKNTDAVIKFEIVVSDKKIDSKVLHETLDKDLNPKF